MKLLLRQKVWLGLVIAVNGALWINPSEVVEEIARQRHVMLGRYSRTHFAWILAVGVLSVVGCYIDWSRGRTNRRRWFQVLATLIFLVPTSVLIDFLVRTPDVEHYVRDRPAYRRPANARFGGEFVDRPEARRSYPRARPGHAPIDRTLQTDARGYRNQTELASYDVVVLGDSFAEGSNVSDEHVWAARLAAVAGRSVYNLGMSGYDPLHYLESLKDTGLSLRPRVVLCLLYEGNDFRAVDADAKRKDPGLGKRLGDYVDRSPIVRAMDRMIIDTFGAMRCDAPLADAARIDWLPLAVPMGDAAKFYAFEPKQLRDLYITSQEFAEDPHWWNPRRQIAEMDDLCHRAGARFAVLYAPTKAHVVLPTAAERLDAVRVRDFTAISYKYELPDPAEFLQELPARADAKEQVVGEWCAKESIPFLSLTPALRQAAVAGRQVYFTYDQHWSPEGHEVVAEAVRVFLAQLETPM